MSLKKTLFITVCFRVGFSSHRKKCAAMSIVSSPHVQGTHGTFRIILLLILPFIIAACTYTGYPFGSTGPEGDTRLNQPPPPLLHLFPAPKLDEG